VGSEYKTINIKIVANPSGVTAGVGKAKSEFRDLAVSVQNAGKTASGSGGGLLNSNVISGFVGGLVGGSVGGFFGKIKEGLAFAVERESKVLGLEREAKMLGISRQTRGAFDILGGAEGGAEFASVLTKMNKLVGEAGDGSEEAAHKLKKFGLSVQDALTNSPTENLQRIADGLMAMSNPAERTAAAMSIFGKTGAQALPMLAKISNGGLANAERLDEATGASGSDEFLSQAKGDTAQRRKATARWEGTKNWLAENMNVGHAWGNFVEGLSDIGSYLNDEGWGFSATPSKDKEQALRLEQEARSRKSVADAEAKKQREADLVAKNKSEAVESGVGLNAELSKEVELFGKSASQVKLYGVEQKLAKAGILGTAEAMRELNKAAAQIDWIENATKAKALTDQFGKSDYQKTSDDFFEAQKLYQGGFIDRGTYGRKLLSMTESLEGRFPAAKTPINLTSGLERGSAGAYSFLAKSNQTEPEKDIGTRMKEALERARDSDAKREEYQRQLVDLAEKNTGLRAAKF
jgi:hypothetical protein